LFQCFEYICSLNTIYAQQERNCAYPHTRVHTVCSADEKGQHRKANIGSGLITGSAGNWYELLERLYLQNKQTLFCFTYYCCFTIAGSAILRR